MKSLSRAIVSSFTIEPVLYHCSTSCGILYETNSDTSNKLSKPSSASSGIIYVTLEDEMVYGCEWNRVTVWHLIEHICKTMSRTESNQRSRQSNNPLLEFLWYVLRNALNKNKRKEGMAIFFPKSFL